MFYLQHKTLWCLCVGKLKLANNYNTELIGENSTSTRPQTQSLHFLDYESAVNKAMFVSVELIKKTLFVSGG